MKKICLMFLLQVSLSFGMHEFQRNESSGVLESNKTDDRQKRQVYRDNESRRRFEEKERELREGKKRDSQDPKQDVTKKESSKNNNQLPESLKEICNLTSESDYDKVRDLFKRIGFADSFESTLYDIKNRKDLDLERIRNNLATNFNELSAKLSSALKTVMIDSTQAQIVIKILSKVVRFLEDNISNQLSFEQLRNQIYRLNSPFEYRFDSMAANFHKTDLLEIKKRSVAEIYALAVFALNLVALITIAVELKKHKGVAAKDIGVFIACIDLISICFGAPEICNAVGQIANSSNRSYQSGTTYNFNF